MPRPNYPHSSTLAGRKVWAKPVQIPSVPASATTVVGNQAQAQAAINDTSKRVIYVNGYIDGVEMNASNSTNDVRYLVFRAGGYCSSINFPYARNWRVTTEDPNYLIPWYIGSSYWTRCRFTNSYNCLVEKVHYQGAHKGASTGGGTFGLWDNSGSGESEDCGFQWIYHENDDTNTATADYVLFGCNGNRPGHFFRSRNGFIYNCRSKNPGDFFQLTSEKPAAGWNIGTSHPGFHIAGIDCWSDIFNSAGRATMHENLIDIKGGSDEDDHRIVLEDFRYFGARLGVHWPNLGARVVNDPGTAGVLHMEQPHNVTFQRGIVWDCTIGWSLQPGYGDNRPTRNAKLNDCLFYDCGNVANQDGYGILMSDDGAGGHEVKRNMLAKVHQPFRASDASGFEVSHNVATRSTGSGWVADANSHSNLSDRSFPGASTAGAAARESRTSDLVIEMPDPNNITGNTGVIVTLTDALIAEQDAPSADFIWVAGNEEAPGGNLVFYARSKTDTTTGESISHTLESFNGTAPVTWRIVSHNTQASLLDLTGNTLTVNSSTGYYSTVVTVEATDADGNTATAQLTSTFERPQVPDVVWTASNASAEGPAGAINDGDTTFDGGWIGSTANGEVSCTALWPVPHDIELIRTMEALDHVRQYYRTWEYTTDGITWHNIPEFGTASALETEALTWNDWTPTITGVVGISRVATGNSAGSEWQRVTEVQIYGTPSTASLNPPTCNGFTVQMGQGETIEITPEQIGALATEDGGDTLSIDASPLSITPSDAGVIRLNSAGNIELTSTDSFAGQIAISCRLRASESA